MSSPKPIRKLLGEWRRLRKDAFNTGGKAQELARAHHDAIVAGRKQGEAAHREAIHQGIAALRAALKK